MVDAVLGRDIGIILCRVFGVDPADVRAITLRNAIDEAATVEVTRFVRNAQMQAIAVELSRYELVLRSSDPAPLTLNEHGLVDTTDLASDYRRSEVPGAPGTLRSVDQRRDLTPPVDFGTGATAYEAKR